MTEIVLGIRLKADGSDLVGQVRVSKDAVKELGEVTAKTTSEAAKLNAEHNNLARTMGASASAIGAYTEGWRQLTDGIFKALSVVKDYIKESATLAARHETLGVVMEVVGRNAGYTSAEMNRFAEGVRKSGITMNESRETVVKLAQANIDLSIASKLARAAQDAAVIGNMNSSEALDRMTHGIVSGQTEILRAIGINVNFEDSYKKVAKQLNVTTEQLTENEKVQARANVVLEYATRLQGTYEAAMGTAGKQINSLKRYEEDLKTIRGEVWNDLLITAVTAYTKSLQDATQASKDLSTAGDLKKWSRELSDDLVTAANWVNNLAVTAELAISRLAAGGAKAALLAKGQIREALAVQADMNQRDIEISNKFDRPRKAYDDWIAAKDDAEAKNWLRRSILDNAAEDTRKRPPAADRPAIAAKGGGAGDNFLISELMQVENELDKLSSEGLSEVDRFLRKVIASGKEYNDEQLLEIITKKGTLDVLKDEVAERKALQEALAREAQARSEADSITAAYYARIKANGDAIDNEIKNIKFETELIGKNNAERERAIAIRNQDAKSAGLTDSAKEQNRERLEEALSAKAAATAADEAQKKSIEENKALWSTVESTGKTVFTNLLSHGKGAAEGIGQAIKSSVIDLLYQLTVRKWIINIGANISASMGMGGTAGATGSAGGGSGGIGNMLSMGNSASNLLGAGEGYGMMGQLGSTALYGTLGGASLTGTTLTAASPMFGAAGTTISQAGMLAADSAVFGTAGTAATMEALGTTAAGAGAAAGAAAAIPYIGWAIAAYSLLSGMGGDDPPVTFNGYSAKGQLGIGGFAGDVMGNFSDASYSEPGENAWLRSLSLTTLLTGNLNPSPDQVAYYQKLVGNRTMPVELGSMNNADLQPQLAAAAKKFVDGLTEELAKSLETLKQQQDNYTSELKRHADDMKAKLGINSLTDYKNSLSVSDYIAPADRFSAARGLLDSTYNSAMGGDLTAVNAFPQMLQQALGIGRDVFASGPEFQSLFIEGNKQLNELLAKQQSIQQEMFAEVPLAISEAGANTVAELRAQTKVFIDGFKALEDQIRMLREIAA